MHLLSLGSVLLTLAFLANASPSFLPDLHHLLTLGSESATSTSPSPPVGGPGKCERKCGPQPRCRPSLANTGSYEKCYQWGDCMKTCEFGPTTPQPPRQCVNNDRTRDSHGWTCTNHYDHFPHDCGHYDTRHFNSYRQCCACKDLVCL